MPDGKAKRPNKIAIRWNRRKQTAVWHIKTQTWQASEVKKIINTQKHGHEAKFCPEVQPRGHILPKGTIGVYKAMIAEFVEIETCFSFHHPLK